MVNSLQHKDMTFNYVTDGLFIVISAAGSTPSWMFENGEVTGVTSIGLGMGENALPFLAFQKGGGFPTLITPGVRYSIPLSLNKKKKTFSTRAPPRAASLISSHSQPGCSWSSSGSRTLHVQTWRTQLATMAH